MAVSVTTSRNPQGGYATNFSLTSGDTVATAITLSISGTPINLTGYTLKCQVNTPTPLILNTTNSGITITNASQGTIQLNVSSAATATIAPGFYQYDLWMVSPSGVETALLAGTFNISQNITAVP